MNVEERALITLAGIKFAWQLGVPFDGALVRDEVGKAIELPPPASGHTRRSNLAHHDPIAEAAKNIIFAIRFAEVEAHAAGLALGLIAPPLVRHSEALDQEQASPPAHSGQTERLRPTPMIGTNGDVVTVGDRLEIRSSGGNNFYIVDIGGGGSGTILGWHPSQAAAQQWAVELITSGVLKPVKRSPIPDRPFTEQ